MSNDKQHPDHAMNPEDKTTLSFMQMVFQLSSLATMLMGKVPHPETGETKRDLEAAQVIIDQLEMLETKTRGNLTADEDQLLKQTLMTLRMAYVEAVNSPAGDTAKDSGPPPPADSAAPASPEAPSPDPPQQDESKKRFTKKY